MMCAEINKHVADLLNHVFENGMQKEYKEMLDHYHTERPSNCHGLVERNTQVLDALKINDKKDRFSNERGQ